MDISDCKENVRQAENVWSKRLFYMALNNNDFPRVNKYYKILKLNNILSSNEKVNYKNRKKRIDYWLYLKNKIFRKSRNN